MPSPSKNKGNAWERDVAKQLTELYGETFIRAPGSGAYVGGSNNARKQYLHEGQIRSFKGDIIPGQSFPKFNAECKSYKDFPFHQLFTGPVKQLDTWLDQLMDAADPGDFNILIMKFNRKGKFVVFNFDENRTHPMFVDRHLLYENKYGRWAIMDYDKFWDLNIDSVKTNCS
jgi:Holliday junction resolvase